MSMWKRRLLSALGALFFAVAPAAAQVMCNNGDDGYTLDFQPLTWSGSGTTTNTWVVNRPSGGDPVSVSFTFTGNTNRFQTTYPQITSLANGGVAGRRALLPLVNFRRTSESLTLNVGFSTQVYNVSIPMFDIDTIAPFDDEGGFRDNVVVRGANSTTGATGVVPVFSTPYFSLPTTTLPPSTVQLFSTDTGRARGNNNDSGVNNPFGNATALFGAPITSFTWAYNNSGITTDDPSQQGVAIHNISFCVPRFANVTSTKTVAVHRRDNVGCGTFPGTPQSGLPAAIPGACVEYTITATNSGAGIARGLNLSDVLDSRHIYRGAQISGFVTTEPGYAFNTPAAGTICGGTSCTISTTNARLNPGGTGTIRIRAEVR